MIQVCFVCLGNICRSPTGEAVFRRLVLDAGLENQISIDSAGTSGWHLEEAPDARATAFAGGRGYELGGLSRQFVASDLDRFDYVIAMDGQNRTDLLALCRTDEHRGKISLMRDHEDGAAGEDVPDPFYGGDGGFQVVLDMCEIACAGLLERIRSTHDLP